MGVMCQTLPLPGCTFRRGDKCLYTGLPCHPDCTIMIPKRAGEIDVCAEPN